MQIVRCLRNDTRHEREDEQHDRFPHSIENVIIFAWAACTPVRGPAPHPGYLSLCSIQVICCLVGMGISGTFWTPLCPPVACFSLICSRSKFLDPSRARPFVSPLCHKGRRRGYQ